MLILDQNNLLLNDEYEHSILEEHANNAYFDEIFDSKDFEDWLKCIA
jgi:hypothetical protein